MQKRYLLAPGVALIAVIVCFVGYQAWRDDHEAVGSVIVVAPRVSSGIVAPYGANPPSIIHDVSATVQRDLTDDFRKRYPTLRTVGAECRGTECVLSISSKGLVDPSERGDIYSVVASRPEELLAGTRFQVRDRQTSLFGDDTTVVELNVSMHP